MNTHNRVILFFSFPRNESLGLLTTPMVLLPIGTVGYYFSRPVTVEEFETKTMSALKKGESDYEKKGGA